MTAATMRLLSKKAHIRHIQRQLLRVVSSLILAVGLLVFTNLELTIFAVLLLAASKWQVLLGGPRLWLYNLRDNGVDITFIASILTLLIIYSGSLTIQIALIGLYLGWQLAIKPLSGVSGHAAQSLMALALASIAVFLLKEILFGVIGMMIVMWVVAAITADHYLVSLSDNVSLRKLLVAAWSLIVVQIVWLLGRWQVFYLFLEGNILIPQATLVLVVMGYMFGAIYHDHHQKQLTKKRLYMYLALITLVTVVLILASEWVSQL